MPSGIKISSKEFKNSFKTIHPELEMINEYVSMKQSLKIKDALGVIYISRPQDLLLGKKPTIQSAEDKNLAFELMSKNIHGDKFDYSLVDYKRAKSKVVLKCKIHGVFETSPDCHLSRGHGCPECGKISCIQNREGVGIGWNLSSWEKQSKKSKLFSGYKLYILKCYNDSEVFIKVGRTYMDVRKRFEDKNKMPYSYDILFLEKSSIAKKIFDLETSLKRGFKNKYKPRLSFAGTSECFLLTPENQNIISRLKLRNKTNKELHFLFSQQEQERLDKLQISGGFDLELEKFNSYKTF